jgi:diguanylate cyclase (GGDEF)-like protein/PAS domain S-box-containing protein
MAGGSCAVEQGQIPRERGVDQGSADDTAALNRRGLLIEVVTECAGEILAAPVVQQALPRVLAAIAHVVRIDRMAIVDMQPGEDGVPARDIFFRWEAPEVPWIEDFSKVVHQSTEAQEMEDWILPLKSGQAVFGTTRTVSPRVREFFNRLGIVSTLLVPIMIDDRHWGHICFDDCDSERYWAADDIKVLKLLAGVVGAAITRERFLRDSRHREALLHSVTRSAVAIMTAADLHEATSRALASIAQALQADQIVVVERIKGAGGAQQLVLRHSWHVVDAPLQLVALDDLNERPPPQAQAWLAPLDQGAVVESSVASLEGPMRDLLHLAGVHSLLLVPIMVDGRCWGHISVHDCRRVRQWSVNEVDILRTLAELLGNANRRERYVEELAKANTIIQNSSTVLYRLRGEPAFPMIYVSQNISLLGYEPKAMIEAPGLYFQCVYPDDRPLVQSALAEMLEKDAPPTTQQFRLLARDGSVRWVENSYTPVRAQDGRLLEVEGILADITERKIAEEKIALLARCDPLTGLANRMTFSDRLRQAFAAARRGAQWFAVLYLDLDHFKEVNDTFGHSAGDQLLQQVSERLRHATREVDLVSRLGGDEFAVLQADVSDSVVAGRLAEKIIDLLSEPYVVAGNQARIGVSVGISLYSIDTEGPDELLAQADQALYRAKESGRAGYRFYSDQIDSEARAHLNLAEDLRHALARGELQMHYQPQVELATNRIVGMEALLRWNHPVRGRLLPEDILPIAEKFGIMPQLGQWVVDEACRQMSLWRAQGMSVPVIAINVSLAQIKAGHEFVHDVISSIERWGLAPRDVELDVTELVLARTTLAQSSVLDELRRKGIGIAIDDFGAQYSSLDYLRTYHVNRLKIARGMIAAASAEPGGLAMVRAILSLAGELGVEVVAEGVETEQQRDLLIRANSKALGQGFYFGRATDADETSKILRGGLILPDTPKEPADS